MNEDNVTQLTPAEEDPVVDRWLSSLERFAPRAGFEDAVMARVLTPAPSWLRSMQAATRSLFAGRRRWVWAGGLAASSAASLAVIVTLASSHWMQVETAWSLLTSGFAVEVWRAVVTMAAQTAGATLALSEFWGLNYKVLGFACLAGGLVTAISLWGLYRVLSIDMERIKFDASR